MTIKILRQGEEISEINPVTQGKAPDFCLKDLEGKNVRLSNLTKTVLISVFPDINTRICSLQTKRFNVEASKHSELEFLSISNNTSEEQKNWCAAEGVDMEVLSDDGQFGKSYGLVMESGGMKGRLARSIFVIKAGYITYSEIVSEISHEPNYEKALEEAEK